MRVFNPIFSLKPIQLRDTYYSIVNQFPPGKKNGKHQPGFIWWIKSAENHGVHHAMLCVPTFVSLKPSLAHFEGTIPKTLILDRRIDWIWGKIWLVFMTHVLLSIHFFEGCGHKLTRMFCPGAVKKTQPGTNEIMKWWICDLVLNEVVASSESVYKAQGHGIHAIVHHFGWGASSNQDV